MAELVGAFAASHGPLIVREWPRVPAEQKSRMAAGFRELGRRLEAARPDVLVVVAPDHWSNFFLDNVPAVCLGVGDTHDGPPEPWMKDFPHREIRGDSSFALHLARKAEGVIALDVSSEALERAKENCALNGVTNVDLVEADTFDYLRERERARETFDTIVLDPPAFAKTRASLPGAIRGYKDINLRAMRLLSRNGLLFTASCSFHLTKPLFLEMLQDAAADSGRRIALRAITAQPVDHPEVVTIPETGYLKGALLEALD